VNRIFTLALLCLFTTIARAADLELHDSDRVVLLGNTLIERDRHHGEFETMLRSRFPGVAFTVRNLAWPGDTTAVQLRPLNYGSLDQHLASAKPSVVFLSFGTSEAFDGPAGLKPFTDGYDQLLTTVKKTNARIILITPAPYDPGSAPQPPLTDHNDKLKLYVDATRDLAARHHAAFVDLFTPLQSAPQPITDNGLHLTPAGYRLAAESIAAALHLGPSKLPDTQREQLRQAIVDKETLWFYRYRAHNAEYIYGRRSQKAGAGADNPTFPTEFAQFDDLLHQADARIVQLSR
jgi:lysophospholipase L1-like esterase